MVKHNGWEETIFSVLILGENFSLVGLSNAIMVAYFSVWYKFIHFPAHKPYNI